MSSLQLYEADPSVSLLHPSPYDANYYPVRLCSRLVYPYGSFLYCGYLFFTDRLVPLSYIGLEKLSQVLEGFCDFFCQYLIYVMAMEGISGQMANAILGVSSNPNVILLVINVLLLVLGMVMEPGAILTLMLPVLLPIAKGLNLDLVQFGVMIVLNLMIGQVTPPFGVCLFVISDVNKMKLEKLYKAVLPFLIPLILTLLLVTYIPGIVTFLPNLLLTTP